MTAVNIVRIEIDERDNATDSRRAHSRDGRLLGIFRDSDHDAQTETTRDRGRTVRVEIQGTDEAVQAVAAALANTGALASLPAATPVRAVRTGADSGTVLHGGVVTDPAEIEAIRARVDGGRR